VFVSILPLTLLASSWWRFDIGMAAGAAMTMYLCVVDEPPEHIGRWLRGSGGERRTARALRSVSAGWLVRHDLSARRGNLDHVVIGSAGVFLLDSKVLGGEVRVHEGVLSVRWLEDVEDGYDLPRLGARVRGASASLATDLATRAGRRVWVQPVVVVWAPFEQGIVESEGVFYVHGEQLADWLRSLPPRLRDETSTSLSSALAGVPPAAS
jgi:hypothetical protein